MTYLNNGAGRPLSAGDNYGNTYASNATYAAPGGVTGLLSNSVIQTTNTYNKRLQPITLSASSPGQTVLSLSYDFHLGNGNNGNVYQIVNNRDNNRTQSFTYDALNRLLTAQTSASNLWGDGYVYDPWGNLLQKNPIKGTAETFAATVNGNNQLQGYSYDAAGNLLNDGLGHVMTYDAEGRVNSAGGVTYTYDGDGNRVQKSNGTLYWGEGPLAESDLSGNIQHEYVFFGGKRLARLDLPSGAIHYYFSDHLGTADVVTNSSGVIENESDYYPWGSERVITQSLANQNNKFTGKERDAESGLDYFGVRYYSSTMGRWMSPDWADKPEPVPYADLSDPQSLNLYGYVRNNPLSRADADGHCPDGVCPIDVPQNSADIDRQNQANGNFLIGIGKGLVNLSTSLVNSFITLGESSSGPIPQFQPSNDMQAAGMVAGTFGGILLSGGAEAPAATTIEQNAARGLASEERVLNSIGETKNTQAVSTSGGKSIPDFQNNRVVGEIKDAKTVSNTRQLRIQKGAAQQSGRQHQLITGTKTDVTKNAAQGTQVIRRKDLGPQ